MKKVIVLAVCLLTFSNVISAQEATKKPTTETTESHKIKERLTVEQRAKKSVDELNAEVTLTEDQKAKVLALATTRATGIDAVRAKYKVEKENKEVAKPHLDSVRKVYRQGVKSILTAEQLEKLKAKHQEKKAAGKPNALEQD